MAKPICRLLIVLPVQFLSTESVAQDVEAVNATEKYLKQRISALEKLQQKQTNYHRKLLAKIDGDSLGYSIDSVTSNQQDKAPQKAIDSLKNIYQFLTYQKAKLGSLSSSGLTDRLNKKLKDLEGKIGEQANLQQRIDQAFAKVAASGNTRQLEKWKKKYDILKTKSEFWKEKLSEPDESEEMALEYLRGVEGFDSYLQRSSDRDNVLSSGSHTQASAEELERMGFQTKRMVKAEMQAEFGDGFYPGGWGGFLYDYNEVSMEGQRLNGPGWRIVPFGPK